MASPQTKLLTPPEAAELFAAVGLAKHHAKWISDQIDRGRINCVLINNRRYVREDMIEEMISGWIEAAGSSNPIKSRAKPTPIDIDPEEERRVLRDALAKYKVLPAIEPSTYYTKDIIATVDFGKK